MLLNFQEFKTQKKTNKHINYQNDIQQKKCQRAFA